ncbi:hypothetical protein E1A91_A04G081400v1 [Gossypium mustelinum]|uniref:Uncharacterized protein n=1 Tax=Gossypium mustelinum TaxID=34275 RepID=A0A5D2ZMS6_GOSMU|nr:hypothetical protein E1A91_A04G081400v1 [Gossypium mustelinum]
MLELIANRRFRHLSSPVPPKGPSEFHGAAFFAQSSFKRNRE